MLGLLLVHKHTECTLVEKTKTVRKVMLLHLLFSMSAVWIYEVIPTIGLG